LHREVCAEIKDWLGRQDGWSVLGIDTSPITGPQGNVEFLIAGRLAGSSND
ncbi:MAG: TlyA family rRNA (cytidine-2'-O)-methyltransferase, partial [Rhodospirillaceae bacterium]|nr:TlyA family rRNA (cytidine-2'-O)-methyltransferase [Rhodospirillaceae bacterium]